MRDTSEGVSALEFVEINGDSEIVGQCDTAVAKAADSQEGQDPASDLKPTHEGWRWKEFFWTCGGGLMMVVAYLDPGNLEADINVGVQAGFALLWWLAICSLVFGFLFQCLSARLGLVTGRDLAQQCGRVYPLGARLLLWLMLEIAIIGADIQETIGCAIAVNILSQGTIPLWAGSLIVSVTAFSLLLLERIGFKQLEAVFGIFIAAEALAMGTNFVQARIPSGPIVRGLFIPTLPRETISVAVSALGALVMPYNIYFHSALVHNRKHDLSTDKRKRTVLGYYRLESFAVLVMAFVVNLFVVCLFAYGFYGNTDVDSIGLESAGQYLGDRFGTIYKYVWAVGLFTSGQVATIGLTYAGQLVMLGLLQVEVSSWKRMVGARLVALVPTVTLAVVFEASNTFDTVAQLLNIVQSLQLPFAFLPVLHLCATASIMTPQFRSRWWVTWFGGAVTAAVTAINGYLLVQLLEDLLPHQAWVAALWGLFMATYFSLVIYFAVGPNTWPGLPAKARAGAGAAGRWAVQTGGKVAYWFRNSRFADTRAMMEIHLGH